MSWGAGRLWRGRVFEHAKSELVVGSLKGQRQVVVAGGGAVLAIAEREPVVEPNGMADDFTWEAMTLVQ